MVKKKKIKIKKKNSIKKVILSEKLFLSNYDVASDIDSLKIMKINLVINCTYECDNKNHENVEYFDCKMVDSLEETLGDKLDSTLNKIDCTIKEGKRVLVNLDFLKNKK